MIVFTDPPKPVPPPTIVDFAPGLTLVSPQSRRGTGPGMIVLVDKGAAGARIEDGIPSPAMKWAEEGYTVIEARTQAWLSLSDPLQTCVNEFKSANSCDRKDKVGLVCYSQMLWQEVASAVDLPKEIVGAVTYLDASSSSNMGTSGIPILAHVAGTAPDGLAASADLKIYNYADQTDSDFATPFTQAFSYATEAVSHTRNLTFLKKLMDGPWFDLETIWEEHTYYEFEARDVEATMNTMVAEPYVNHIPTITGGIGRKALTEFYTNHFVFSNPEGTALELISRTVGIDRVVDEFIFKLNHNRQVDWLLPGVPPTGKDLAIPFMAVVNVRGDRLYHEHITWDQATALRQAGLLPDALPYENNGVAAKIRLPVAGVEAVEKMRNKNAVPSNEMMKYGVQNS